MLTGFSNSVSVTETILPKRLPKMLRNLELVGPSQSVHP